MPPQFLSAHPFGGEVHVLEVNCLLTYYSEYKSHWNGIRGANDKAQNGYNVRLLYSPGKMRHLNVSEYN